MYLVSVMRQLSSEEETNLCYLTYLCCQILQSFEHEEQTLGNKFVPFVHQNISATKRIFMKIPSTIKQPRKQLIFLN